MRPQVWPAGGLPWPLAIAAVSTPIEGVCCSDECGIASARSVRVQLIRQTNRQVPARSAFAGFRFPPEVIALAVRWYLRFGLSYRDVEELLGVCSIELSQVIFAGRFAVGTALGAPRPVRRDLVSTGWRHSEGLPTVRSPAKITCDSSMQQTRRD
jgi:hypothetical protein